MKYWNLSIQHQAWMMLELVAKQTGTGNQPLEVKY
jgi:hypothetical protein